MLILLAAMATSASGATYYMSPDGDDGASGVSEAAPWGTFGHAFDTMEPGDTLLLMDGVYRQTLGPKRSGEPGKPITIRALNDGMATIDGEFERVPVWIDRDWITVEGIVARNSRRTVYSIMKGSHNVLRRCTGYNANPDKNAHVFGVTYPEAQHNLLEDCAASGTGRKMFMFFLSKHNTMRRCFANWQRWDGREHPRLPWPNGANLQFYGANHCTMENCIGVGRIPAWWSVSMFAQANTKSCIGNRILGTIALNAGTNEDGGPRQWGERPDPCEGNVVHQGYRAPGLLLVTSAGRPCRDNVFRDCFASGNIGSGLVVNGPVENCVVDHVTLRGNGGQNLRIDDEADVKVTNCNVEGTEHTGEGARLTHRYVDGELTDEPLWPWPMEERIQREMGISVTEWMTEVLALETK
ncbi:MAG: chondroitinase-B domain-containing protein [Candidatus Brocadiia bacterium]